MDTKDLFDIIELELTNKYELKTERLGNLIHHILIPNGKKLHSNLWIMNDKDLRIGTKNNLRILSKVFEKPTETVIDFVYKWVNYAKTQDNSQHDFSKEVVQILIKDYKWGEDRAVETTDKYISDMFLKDFKDLDAVDIAYEVSRIKK